MKPCLVGWAAIQRWTISTLDSSQQHTLITLLLRVCLLLLLYHNMEFNSPFVDVFNGIIYRPWNCLDFVLTGSTVNRVERLSQRYAQCSQLLKNSADNDIKLRMPRFKQKLFMSVDKLITQLQCITQPTTQFSDQPHPSLSLIIQVLTIFSNTRSHRRDWVPMDDRL